MNLRNHKIILTLIVLMVAANIYGNTLKPIITGSRKVVSLNGTWQIAEGGMGTIPVAFNREIPVPGLVDMAIPAFINPGPKVSSRRIDFNKDNLREVFGIVGLLRFQGRYRR